ncbi:MAG: NHL repeat-containing protein [Deltaproteobacteria bacterium]|nr:NHL repeat-containing protein [Candidatus Anaeroferrophillus wilburensis]MBN2887827.1 NHL repeat-containing protein [Deltaproteobacteria bacterium]
MTTAAGGEHTPSYEARCLQVITTDDRGSSLSYPSRLYYDRHEDEIYALCEGGSKIIIYTSDFFPVASIGSGRGFTHAKSCSTANNQLYLCISDDTGGHLQILDRALLPSGKIFFSGFKNADAFQPFRAEIIDNHIYVTGNGGDGVLIADLEGRWQQAMVPLTMHLGIREKAPIETFAIDAPGNRIYLLSEEMGKIFVFSLSGRFLYDFGEKGGSSGKLSRPRGIALDQQRNLVYIVDYMRHSISVYSDKGDYLFEFGGKGYSRGWLAHPSDLCVDGQGRLWVADTFNQRLQVFSIVEK